MKTRSSPSQLSSKKGYGAIAVSQASGVKDTVQLTLISVRFRRATQRSGRARSVRGFGGPSPVKSGEVARGPETTPWLVGVAVCDGRPPEDRFDIKSTSAPTPVGLRQPGNVQGCARAKEEDNRGQASRFA
jgi:hypothetical protein